MGERCCALNDDGKRCRRTRTKRFAYIGDPEIYRTHERAEWVTVSLCMHHSYGIVSSDNESAASEHKGEDVS